VSFAHHVVLSCDHARCEARMRVRMISGTGDVRVARQAAVPFGWVARPVVGAKGKNALRDYCPAHAGKYPQENTSNDNTNGASK
jgi:hypothetical protein